MLLTPLCCDVAVFARAARNELAEAEAAAAGPPTPPPVTDGRRRPEEEDTEVEWPYESLLRFAAGLALRFTALLLSATPLDGRLLVLLDRACDPRKDDSMSRDRPIAAASAEVAAVGRAARGAMRACCDAGCTEEGMDEPCRARL